MPGLCTFLTSLFVEHTKSGLILNPPAEVRLHKNTLGFFVTESTKDVKRAAFYCAACHSDVYTPELIGKCSCKSKNHRHITALEIQNSFETYPMSDQVSPKVKMNNKGSFEGQIK